MDDVCDDLHGDKYCRVVESSSESFASSLDRDAVLRREVLCDLEAFRVGVLGVVDQHFR